MIIILFILLGLTNLILGCYLFENKPQDYFILVGASIWFFNAYWYWRYIK